MTGHRYRALALPAALVMCLAGFLLAQDAPQDQAPPNQETDQQADQQQPAAQANPAPNTGQKVLVIDGKQVPGAAMQVGGHYYVSLDSLAEATNGSLTIEPNRIVLITRGAAAEPPTGPNGAPPPSPAPPEGMTRDFARQSLSALAYVREWKAALATVVSFGVPVVGTWPDDYRDRVQEGIAQSQVAAASPEDLNALALLQNEAANLMSWSAQVVSQRQSLNASQNVTPNALGDDPLYQKISKCADFLNEMLGSGVYADDSSCH